MFCLGRCWRLPYWTQYSSNYLLVRARVSRQVVRSNGSGGQHLQGELGCISIIFVFNLFAIFLTTFVNLLQGTGAGEVTKR